MVITRSQHVKKNIKNKKSIINGNQGRNKYNKPLFRYSSLYCRNKESKEEISRLYKENNEMKRTIFLH